MADKKKKKVSIKKMRELLRKVRILKCAKCKAKYHWDEKLRRCVKTSEAILRKNREYLRKHVSKSNVSTKKDEVK